MSLVSGAPVGGALDTTNVTISANGEIELTYVFYND